MEKYEIGNGILYCGDSVEILPQLTEEVGLIVTDPPYGSKAFDWDNASLDLYRLFFREAHRLLRDGSAIFVFFVPVKLHWFLPEFTKYFSFRNLIVWHHPNLYAAGKSYGGDRFKSSWQAIIYGIKGDKPRIQDAMKCLYQRYGRSLDVIIHPANLRAGHPAEKPVEILERLVACYSRPGEIVLDPFAGSGSTLLAAERLGRRWIGVERDPRWCKLIQERLAEVENGWW